MTVGRIKTYPAQTGYVWEYYLSGQSERADGSGTAYAFQVSRDRTNFTPVEVVVEESAVSAWATAHGRELAAPERFAAAKLRLMAAFDEGTPPSTLAVTPENIDEVLAPLELS